MNGGTKQNLSRWDLGIDELSGQLVRLLALNQGLDDLIARNLQHSGYFGDTW